MGGFLVAVAPGVYRRDRSEVEDEVNERCCGMAWDAAVEFRKKLFRDRVEILRIFADAGRRR
jgi:hypothetical protein